MPEIEPKNLTAQLNYRAAGNPPSTQPISAIANCFPGLEFDFRNVWKNLLVGVELHESDNIVVNVEVGGPAAQAGVSFRDALISVDGHRVDTNVRGPQVPNGQTTTLARGANLEWTNAVADVLALQGQDVPCVFRRRSNNQEFTVTLKVRQLFDGALLVENYADGPFKGTVAAPGVLTQGLCSPWQADYRECGCYYWAASRPDFVNFEAGGASSIAGDNWMQKQRAASGQKRYEFDRPSHEDPNNPPPQWTYEELYRDWEKLKFQIGGADE